MKPKLRIWVHRIFAAAWVPLPRVAAAQALTETLIGTAREEQVAAVVGSQVCITSAALIGGRKTMPTSEACQFRFSNLAPGSYTSPGRQAWSYS